MIPQAKPKKTPQPPAIRSLSLAEINAAFAALAARVVAAETESRVLRNELIRRTEDF